MSAIRKVLSLISVLLLSAFAGASVSSSALVVIPRDAQQIISVDYRALSQTQQNRDFKDRFLPPQLGEFENAVRSHGVAPERDINRLLFVTYRDEEGRLLGLTIAQGFFDVDALKKSSRKSAKITTENNASINFAVLDSSLAVFGEPTTIKLVRTVYRGEAANVTTNSAMNRLLDQVDDGLIWSVLDPKGTEEIIHSIGTSLNAGSALEPLVKKIQGLYYTVSANDNINVQMNMVTSDAVTASLLTKVLQFGTSARQLLAKGAENRLLEKLHFVNDGSKISIRAVADPKDMKDLADTPLISQMMH